MAKAPGLGLIVGLGNPGEQYVRSRHNVGFWFVERLAEEYSASFRLETKFGAEACRVSISDRVVWLLKPQSYMNNSGTGVAAFAEYYKLDAKQTLVVHDDLALACGRIQIKTGGGHGGHNGLRNIALHFDSQFYRARIGIDHPGKGRDVANYVLKAPPKDQHQQIEAAGSSLLAEIEALVDGDFDQVSTRLQSQTN
ncbi:MAG: PTH1 family peptidyl-tRNA hydrolase [Gammaproteobacteria bacterium]